MSIVKSKIIKQLKINYPNFYNKDLEKLTKIILLEIKNALKNNSRVELRGFGVFYSNTQKKSIRRNPKTGDKIFVPEKKTVNWKMSKEVFKIINDK